mmetsp:Transcript_4354/g.7792  ORF Transcript_4354/g.7792 Transcript_4354/m.7792 type:complete len:271 (-) Transcript_4354:7-819(-)
MSSSTTTTGMTTIPAATMAIVAPMIISPMIISRRASTAATTAAIIVTVIASLCRLLSLLCFLASCILSNLIERLGFFFLPPGFPVMGSNIHQILVHEARPGAQPLVSDKGINFLKAHPHEITCTGLVNLLSNRRKQIDQGLVIFVVHLIIFHILEIDVSAVRSHFFQLHETRHAVTHNFLTQHFLLIQFSNELDVSQHLLLDLDVSEFQFIFLFLLLCFGQAGFGLFIFLLFLLQIHVNILFVKLVFALVQEGAFETILLHAITLALPFS